MTFELEDDQSLAETHRVEVKHQPLPLLISSQEKRQVICLPSKFSSTFHPLTVLLFPEWNTASPSSEPPVTRVSEKDNSWLYTLDPILVTIIVMSSLGVLLGAVCTGLLLYCPCSLGSLSSRSSTTLENYNFELYDGLKHKVKLNQQRCCTEAWGRNRAERQVLRENLSLFHFLRFTLVSVYFLTGAHRQRAQRRTCFLFGKRGAVQCLLIFVMREPMREKPIHCEDVSPQKYKYLHISVPDSCSTKREWFINAS